MIKKIIEERKKLEIPFCSKENLLVLLAEKNLFENKLIRSSIDQAVLSHGKQKRVGGGNYLEEHIFPVTYSVINNYKKVTPEIISSAILHDVLEDDPSFQNTEGENKFKEVYGKKVFDNVSLLTKPDCNDFEGENIGTKKRHALEYYFSWINLAPEEVKIIKIVDRENNIFSAHKFNEEKMKKYINETKKYILPFSKEISPQYYNSMRGRIKKLKELYLDKFDIIEETFSIKEGNGTSFFEIIRDRNILKAEAKQIVNQLNKETKSERNITSSKLIDCWDGWYPGRLETTTIKYESYKYFYRRHKKDF
jgi:hypothetical protein